MFNSNLLLLTLLLVPIAVEAQDIAAHRWNERVLILLTDEYSSPVYQQQLLHLQEEIEGLDDRRIAVYQATSNKYCQGLGKEPSWSYTDKIYGEFSSSTGDIEVLLIGLDSGIKLRKQEFVSANELFNLIDRMPMRRAELRRKGKS